MSSIRVYNTLTRTKEPFEPIRPGQVGIYLCGPTVYREAHIGHMVGPVIFDVIKRYLSYSGYQVTWVVNITDVDDKLIAEANRRGVSMEQVAEEMTADYLANLQALGVDQIDQMPRATENIEEILGFIQTLIGRDYAYTSNGDVFFDVGKDAEYGKLSNRSPESLVGEGGEAAAKKRSPADFALWKAAKPGEPAWPSPWGPGRPGWHIECSAMSRRLLGETFDIHGGGLDLIFPHHENELAQSECCHGKPMVKYWLHNGLMKADAQAGKVGGRASRQPAPEQPRAPEQAQTPEQAQADSQDKLSRSKGAGGLAELIGRYGGEVLRFFLLRTHYRSTILFSDEGLQETAAALETFYRFFQRYHRLTDQDFFHAPDRSPITLRQQGQFDPGDDPWLQQVHRLRTNFLAKMDDDFNTGAAISELFELVRVLNRFIDQQQLEDPAQRTPEKLAALEQGVRTLRELTAVLGLFGAPPPTKAGAGQQLAGKLVELLIDVRAELRKKKEFALADQVREGLGKLGITLEDRKGGTDWRIDG